MSSRIVIIGGHGKIALLATPLLTSTVHTVTSVVRNPDHVSDVEAHGATGIVCDVEHAEEAEIADVLGGHDVVVWAAGAGGGDPDRTYAVDRDAAIRSMGAAVQAGVNRYVMISYSGAGSDNVPADSSFHAYAEAKAAADDHLRATTLDWTILGPSMLTDDEPTGLIELTDKGASVSRPDVASVIAATIDESATTNKTIWFNSGSTPIAAALGSL